MPSGVLASLIVGVLLAAGGVLVVGLLSRGGGGIVGPARAEAAASPVFEGPVPRAECGPGSLPEDGLQGQVPLRDRRDGRSKLGYRCNLERVGRYQGDGASWVSPSYGHCAYIARRFLPGPTDLGPQTKGVEVLDVSNPSHPRLSTTLNTPGMLGPWESLKIDPGRGLLAAVFVPVPPGAGGGFMDVYDIKTDCAHPRLLGSISALALLQNALRRGDLLGGLSGTLQAVELFGHEANWSPDGRTYWSSATALGYLTAIDMTDPTHPRLVWAGSTGLINHGFGFSADGNQLYIAETGNFDRAVTAGGLGTSSIEPDGLKIFDISDIQARRRNPQIHALGHVYWTDGAIGQHTIPISYGGHPYVVFVDEAGQGAARIIDISDVHSPRIVSKLKLEIQMPDAGNLRAADLKGEGFFGYEGHYCAVDRQTNPTALACGYFQSGVRVFDIRDPLAPREIAYYNPPAQTGNNARLTGSEHAGLSGTLDISQGSSLPSVHGPAGLTADWCSSPPRFVGKKLWVTCQDNGFMVLNFSNHAYPLSSTSVTTGPQRLRLTVSPARTATGCHRFRLRTTVRASRRSTAVAGARVTLHGRRAITNARGYASITACLSASGRYTARARKSRYRPAIATIRVI